MTPSAVQDLVAAFGAEHAPGSPARRAADRALAGDTDARGTLRALLTVRSAGVIATPVRHALDRLLEEETTARGSVDATALPLLVDTHGVAGVLGDHVALWRGDLTRLAADAVVNAANEQLLGCFVPEHRCIDNVIHAVAGPALRADCDAYMSGRTGPEPTGSAVLTAGHHLPAGHVIHTVGPIVRGPLTTQDIAMLASSYRSILDLAAANDLGTVGFCSISTGVFGFPKDAAAQVALDTIERWFTDRPDAPQRAVISLFADVDVTVYEHALMERSTR